MKEQLIINRLILEIYGDYGMVTVGMKQIAALNSGGMAKLLKWIAHIHEIFMWMQNYRMRITSDSYSDISRNFSLMITPIARIRRCMVGNGRGIVPCSVRIL